jgi:hypothetical protein
VQIIAKTSIFYIGVIGLHSSCPSPPQVLADLPLRALLREVDLEVVRLPVLVRLVVLDLDPVVLLELVELELGVLLEEELLLRELLDGALELLVLALLLELVLLLLAVVVFNTLSLPKISSPGGRHSELDLAAVCWYW